MKKVSSNSLFNRSAERAEEYALFMANYVLYLNKGLLTAPMMERLSTFAREFKKKRNNIQAQHAWTSILLASTTPQAKAAELAPFFKAAQLALSPKAKRIPEKPDICGELS